MLKEQITSLREKIECQKEINIKLYNSIPSATKEDPCNLKAEKHLEEWREGAKSIRELEKELNEKLNALPKKQLENKRTFVNAFGEATKREITNTTYEKTSKRLSKQIMHLIS